MTPPALQISVVIPSYNRRASLSACLKALSRQTAPTEAFEVLVVDDGSPAPLDDLISEYQAVLQLRLLRQSQKGPASARNAGAFAARGTHLAFTDDDCRPAPDWIANLAQQIALNPAAAIGGPIKNALSDRQCSTASQLLIEYLYEFFNTGSKGPQFFITSNVVFPAAVFRGLGGFDTTFPLAAGEDRDICDRWMERGEAMVFADDAVVHHAHPLSLRSFWRQHFNYGRGARFVHLARARRGQHRMRVGPPGFYVGLLHYTWKQLTGFRAFTGCLLAALSQVAYLTGFLRERFAPSRRPTDIAPRPDPASRSD